MMCVNGQPSTVPVGVLMDYDGFLVGDMQVKVLLSPASV